MLFLFESPSFEGEALRQPDGVYGTAREWQQPPRRKGLQITRTVMPPVLRLFLAQAKHWLPAYTPIIDIILHCNLLQRKTILTLSRCQLVPSYPHDTTAPTSYAYKQLGPSLETLVYIEGQAQTLHYLLSSTAILFSTPVSAGLINMLVRNLPLATADEEYPVEIKKGIDKEILAAISKYHPTSFNWDSLFNFSTSWRQPNPIFHPEYPFDRETFYRISVGLQSTKRDLQQQLFYPNTSTKTIGSLGYEEFQRYAIHLQDYDYDPGVVTTIDLEAGICDVFYGLRFKD